MRGEEHSNAICTFRWGDYSVKLGREERLHTHITFNLGKGGEPCVNGSSLVHVVNVDGSLHVIILVSRGMDSMGSSGFSHFWGHGLAQFRHSGSRQSGKRAWSHHTAPSREQPQRVVSRICVQGWHAPAAASDSLVWHAPRGAAIVPDK